MPRKASKKKVKTPDPRHKEAVEIVFDLLKHKIDPKNPSQISREIKNAYKLLDLESKDFWMTFSGKLGKINSLAFFFTDFGKEFINKETKKITNKKPEKMKKNIEFGEKIGQDKQIRKSYQSIFDF